MKARARSRLFESIAAVLLFAIVCAYTVILLLNDGPNNAIKIAEQPFLNQAVPPVLSQNWSFFAPTPLEHDVYVLARAQDASGKWTSWMNVSQFVGGKIKRNRFSNFDLLDTGLHNEVLNTASYDVAHMRARKQNMYSLDPVRFIARTSMSFLEYEYPNRHFTRLQCGVLQRLFPRFTKRYDNDDKDKRTFTDLGTEAAPTDVAVIRW